MWKDMEKHSVRSEITKPVTIVARYNTATNSPGRALWSHITLTKKKYHPHCYPRDTQGEEDTEYGNITSEEMAFDYNMTFKPKFYTAIAQEAFYMATYAKKTGRPAK